MAAAGGLLAYAGTKNNSGQKDSLSTTSVTLNASPHDAYEFYRDFESWPRFMSHLETVTRTGERTYRFTARGPMNSRIRWDAEVIEDRENEFIGWRSLPGSEVDVNGLLEFRKATGDRGTLVVAAIEYRAPVGGLGSTTRFLNKTVEFVLRQDLRRSKALIETGEIPTTEGQSHGPRSVVTGVLRTVDPSKPPRGDYRIREVVEPKRRVS